MGKHQENKSFSFHLETYSVTETQSDNELWSGDDVFQLDELEIQEITKDDNDPFYVEFVALYEGLSKNNCHYTKDAVKSCANAMLGVNMYKGHVEPGTAGWKYREPAGKVIASRLTEIESDGKKVLAALGKAYITEAEPKLRSDIRKRMAGSVSILGDAKGYRKVGSPIRNITELTKPLKSVDFCNPNTGGMPLAGVTAIVREMSENVESNDTRNDMKLTKEELLAEYGKEIKEIVSEQIDSDLDNIADERKALKEERTQHEEKVAEFEATIQEIKEENEKLKADLESARNELQEVIERAQVSELNAYATNLVAEMKADKDANEKVIDIAVSEVEAVLVDGDLDKSKEQFKTNLEGKVAKLLEVAEIFKGNSKEPNRKVHGDNQKKSQRTVADILSPDLSK